MEITRAKVEKTKTFKRYKQLQDEAIHTARSIDLLERDEGSIEALAAALVAGVEHYGYSYEQAEKAGKFVAVRICDDFFKDFYKADSYEEKIKILHGAIGATSFAIEDKKVPSMRKRKLFGRFKKKPSIEQQLAEALTEALPQIKKYAEEQERKAKAKKKFEEM